MKAENHAEGAKVSVVMCTYNGAEFLRDQIDSILAQTYPIHELIVQDDMSSDGSADILAEYAADTRVSVFINENRMGYNRNFSTALNRATGDFIAVSDQDDIWMRDKIETLMRNIDDNMLIFHNSAVFHGTDTSSATPHFKGDVAHDGAAALLKFIMSGHECMFRRELLDTYSRAVAIEPDIIYDCTLLVAANAVGKTRYLDESLVMWRRHDNAATAAIATGKKEPTMMRKSALGIVTAFAAMRDKKKTELSARFFRAVSTFHFADRHCAAIVAAMAKGSLLGALRAGMVCATHYRRNLYPDKNAAMAFIDSLFYPLFSIRDRRNLISNPAQKAQKV